MRHEINLFDPALRKPKVLLPARQVVAAWGFAASALLLLYGWQWLELTRARHHAKLLAAESAALTAAVRRLGDESAARKPSREAETELAQRGATLREREAVLARLEDGDFGSTSGHARFLRALARQVPDGLWLTGVTVHGDGRDIRVEGRTTAPPLVATFLGSLGTESALEGRAFNVMAFQRPFRAGDTGEEGEGSTPPPFLEFVVASRDLPDAKLAGPQ